MCHREGKAREQRHQQNIQDIDHHSSGGGKVGESEGNLVGERLANQNGRGLAEGVREG